MRKTIKAVLLSALVLPGTGHLSLKKPVHGWVLIGITVVCLFFILSTVFEISKDLSGKIQSGDVPYDKDKVTELVTEKLSGGDYQFLSYAVLILMVCWIFGVVDSFRIGRMQDKDGSGHKSF